MIKPRKIGRENIFFHPVDQQKNINRSLFGWRCSMVAACYNNIALFQKIEVYLLENGNGSE